MPARPARDRHAPTQYEVVLSKGACGFGIYFTASADGAAVVDPATPFYRLPDDALAPGEASGVIAPGDRLLAINETSVEHWRFADVVDELRRTPLGDAALRFQRQEDEPHELHSGEDDQDEDAVPPLELAADADAAVEETHDGNDRTEFERSTVTPKRVRWKLFDWPTTTASGDTPTAASTSAATTSPHGDAMNRSAAMEELLVEMENRLHALEDAVEREKKCRFLAEKKNILYRNALCALSDENAQLRHALAAEALEREAARRFQRRKLQLRI